MDDAPEYVKEMVAPPTRRWSPRIAEDFAYITGSPAHTGMVPARTCRSRSASGFPRPRGDGPQPYLSYKGTSMVHSPPAGIVPGQDAWRSGSARFLRPAGMVPTAAAAICQACRFPRPAGMVPVRVGPA
jgi:hypothetical protein